MTLRKIITIKNVGRFLNYSASGDVDLKRYNLIFAENGRGKTTLCAILRSLQSGDPAHIVGRTTLGGNDAPEINLRTDASNATFSRGVWNATLPALAIFDSTFVSENVYSGDVVGLDHRRNLYRVIIGKEGVDLARQVDQIDADIKAKTSEIKDKRADVQMHAPQGITVETFLTLTDDPEIDAKITANQKDLEAVRQADLIRAHSALTPLTFPDMPDGVEALLSTTVAGLAADAERRVAAQIEAHGMHSEAWLSEGRGYIRNHACPFCGQSLNGVTLIVAYNAYFTEAYDALRRQIAQLRNAIATAFGDGAIAQVQNTIDLNHAGADFWTRYCEIGTEQ